MDWYTAKEMAKISSVLYGNGLLNIVNSKQLSPYIPDHYKHKGFINLMLLTNIIISKNFDESLPIDAYTISNFSMSVTSSANIENYLEKLVKEIDSFENVKSRDIRNCLKHQKFNFGFNQELNSNVLVLKPNKSLIQSKDYKKIVNEIPNFERYKENNNMAPILITEIDLYNYIKNNINFETKENIKENSPLEIFALVSLILYNSINNIDYKLSKKDIKSIKLMSSFCFQLAPIFPICIYAQDEVYNLRKTYEQQSISIPKVVEDIFTIRDMIVHNGVEQIYQQKDYIMRFYEQSEKHSVNLVIDNNFGQNLIKRFENLFNTQNKIDNTPKP